MFFTENYVPIRLISVLELEWGVNIQTATERSFHALSFRLHGNADFTVHNSTTHAGVNDILYVPKGMSYHMQHAEEHLIVAHFDILDNSRNKEFELLSPHNKHEFQTLFRSLYQTWTSSKPGCQYAAASVFYKILDEIQKERWKMSPISSSERLSEIISYIHTNFADPDLSVKTLSEEFGTSETYFRNVFKTYMGVTPLKYINGLRTAYATELLRSGYYSVTEAAEKSGFSDPKYFSKVMKAIHNLPPSLIKKQ